MSNNTRRIIPAALAFILLASVANAQTDPTPQSLPYTQDFGSTEFTTVPAGMAAWSGLSGSSISDAAKAAASIPTTDATLSGKSGPTSTGGSYGLAISGNARFYIQSSSSGSEGANQLALALDTTGAASVSLDYDVENIKAHTRTVGIVCQFRVSTTAPWNTLVPSSGNNPYSQSNGTTGDTKSIHITLPPAAAGHPNVQIRWAIWRGDEGGSSSGLAIDNISATGSTISNILTISLTPTSLPETSGTDSAVATITTANPVTEDTSVTLTIDDDTEALVSSSNPALIPSGSSSVTFDLTIIDDFEADDSQLVTIRATAPHAVPAFASLTVTDNEAPWSPPLNHYTAADGLAGQALKDALKIISNTGAYQYSYSGTYAPIRAIHEDPSNPDNLLPVYSGTPIGKYSTYYVGQDSDITWSREHIWPVSFGLDPEGVNPGYEDGDAGPDYTDLFNLRPCLQYLNIRRGNAYFDESSGLPVIPPLAPLCSEDDDSWEPRDEEKGDIARTIFYMATRYDGTDPKTLDLEIGDTPSTGIGRFAKLGTLLLWHHLDPVSDRERQQNHLIHTTYQNNRNPFVDHPEYVDLIWPGALTDKAEVAVTEGGSDDSYTLVLTRPPQENVIVLVSDTPAGRLAFSPSSVTFTPANWDTAQTITVSAIDDTEYQPPGYTTIENQIITTDAGYSTVIPNQVMATITDDDPFISPTALPFTYDGPWTSLPNSGFQSTGLGSYASDLGPDTNTGSAKFGGTGVRLTVSFNESPQTLSYRLKGNPSGGSVTDSVFQILESPDGNAFSVVRTHTDKDNTDELFNESLLPATRFVSFLYQTKIFGNIQLDKLSITAASPWIDWQTLHGLNQSSGAFNADPDSDGLHNLVEYALGRSPTASDPDTTSSSFEKSGIFRITTILRISDSSLTVVAETTTDLNSPASWTSTGITRSAAADQSGVPPGFERSSFETNASADTRFIRLRFSYP